MIAVPIPDRWDGHQLVLASAREGGDALAGWVERGLRLQEKVLYAAYGDHTSVDELVASLDAHGVDASAAAEDGRLEVVEPARLYRADGYTGLVDQARREGYPGSAPSSVRRRRGSGGCGRSRGVRAGGGSPVGRSWSHQLLPI